MTLKFCSFSSGSSGNCYLVKTDNTAILVDAGISGKKIMEGLERTSTSTDSLLALLVTHEHSDHTKSVKYLTKKYSGLTAFANEKTWDAMGKTISEAQIGLFSTGETFCVGDIEVKSFSVSHDAADPVGFSFYKDGKQISIVTDTGYIGEEIIEEIKDADLLILEANHDMDMLRISKYPRFLKERVLGEKGHLSNIAAGQTLLRILKGIPKVRCVLLAHLSRENNFPEMAYQTIKNILEEENYYIGKDIQLNTILRDEVSCIYCAY
ncbi:MAG: MBL fold metallo-hydrolase [Anaerovorax sp.]